MKPTALLAFVAGLGLSFQAWSATVAESVEIENPYVRMVPPNAPATAAFMVIKNKDGSDHALVSAKAYINDKTELHTHVHDKGVMRMRQVPKIDLPAQQSTSLQPGGLHVMLIGLNQPVQEGQEVKIDLTFEDGSTKTIEAEGRPLMMPMMKAGMGGMKHMGHGGMNHGAMGMNPMGMGQGMTMTNGRNTHPMVLVMHANPAFPNLTGVAVKNAAELGLNADQVAKLKAWTKSHGDHMKHLFQSVRALEKELIQDALAGMSKAEMMKKFDKTLAMRKEIAETKIDCRDNMKKVLTPAQFEKLASIYPMM